VECARREKVQHEKIFVGNAISSHYAALTFMSSSISIKVIDSDSAPLCVERIFVDASGELRARVSGVECCVSGKPALVEAGLVVLEPLDMQLARQRPVFTRLNVGAFAGQVWCVVTDHRLVNAAQRFNALKRHGLALTEHQIWPTAPQE
jgi:hypothetical protein